MKANKLYSFISLELQVLKGNYLQKDCFQFKVNKDNQNYLLYEIPKENEKITIKDEHNNCYHLSSHHISFYEKQIDNNPYLSQYHYTAYFSDDNNKKYQLHVYFNHNDQLTTDPVFSMEEIDSNRQLITPEFAEYLTQLAIINTFNLIAELRGELQNTSTTLEKKFITIEQQLTELSSNLEANKDCYLILLEKAIGISDLLSIYLNSLEYRGIANLFNHIKNTMEPSTSSTLVAIDHDEDSEIDLISNNANLIQSNIKDLPKKKTKLSLREDIKQTIVARDLFYSLEKDASFSLRVEKFTNFEKIVRNSLMLTEDKCYIVTTNDLQQLQMLMFQMTAAGKNLLESLLLKREFKLADALRNYTIYFPNTYIGISLAAGNEQLLDFLLTHGECTINTFLIRGLSPVRFCFENHNSKFPKIECLSVLIKHGASLLVSAQDGLPIAYHILSTIQHPLYKALLDHAETTLARKGFYRALIKSLENKIEKMEPDDPIRQNVLNNIQLINAGRFLQKSKIEQKLFTKALNTSQPLSKNFEKDALLALKNDQEYQQALSVFLRTTEDCTQKLSVSQKRQALRNGNSELETWNELLKSMDLKSVNIKEESIKYLEVKTHQIKLVSELIDVQNEIKQSPLSHKKAQKLQIKQSNLRKEINELERKISSKIEVLKKPQDPFESVKKLWLPLLDDLSQFLANDEQDQEMLQKIRSAITSFPSNLYTTNIPVEKLEPSIQNNEEESDSLNQIQNRKMTFFGATKKSADNSSEGCQQNNILTTDQTP
jgi:hypothetical protein